MRPVRHAGLLDHALGAALALVYVALLARTAPDLALTRDESFYVHAADQYGAWLELAWRDPGKAVTRAAIQKGWEYNHEHPALMKTLFALGGLAQKHGKVFAVDSTAYRFPAMVTGGLLLWLVYVFGARAHSRRAGLMAALLVGFMPRVFYHAHLACFDLPIAFMLTWTTYAYWRSLSSVRWAWVTGVAYGAALATKHNAWILPGVLLVHWTWVRLSRRGADLPAASRWPLWLVAMVIVGVPLFVLSWPWLWYDGWARFKWYANFHLTHVHYSIQYLGTTYWRPPFPLSYPWVMTLFTVPLTTLLLALGGVASSARELLPPPLARRLGLAARDPDGRATRVLWFGAALAPLLVFAYGEAPIFGGTKHWFAAYPFLALFAGVAADGLLGRVGVLLPRGRGALDVAAAAGVSLLFVTPSFVEAAHAHPFGLSHYAVAAGGVQGAADKGMNRQFWGFTHGPLAPWFRERMPKGGKVWLCDATAGSWRMLQRDGKVPRNIGVAQDLGDADYAIVHHEEHFAEVDFQIWQAYGTVAPVEVLTYDGVPLVSVYQNPRRARPPR